MRIECLRFRYSSREVCPAVQLEHTTDSLVCRRGHAPRAAELDHISGEPVALKSIPAFQIRIDVISRDVVQHLGLADLSRAHERGVWLDCDRVHDAALKFGTARAPLSRLGARFAAQLAVCICPLRSRQLRRRPERFQCCRQCRDQRRRNRHPQQLTIRQGPHEPNFRLQRVLQELT